MPSVLGITFPAGSPSWAGPAWMQGGEGGLQVVLGELRSSWGSVFSDLEKSVLCVQCDCAVSAAVSKGKDYHLGTLWPGTQKLVTP